MKVIERADFRIFLTFGTRNGQVISSLIQKGDNMGDKGKKDKGKREVQKNGATLKEKRKQKKDKAKTVWENLKQA
ncbi:MAG: hypothetical protein V2I97_19890 [Desulfococcaceae bacterium]|nr:hypothetical protein [Desulfococcaceae bacterium]